MDRYFNQFQPWITQQPKKRSDVAPSVFEYNLATITDAAEREAEWNSTGLGSGLNPIVSRNYIRLRKIVLAL
jgi:hypothetical protein